MKVIVGKKAWQLCLMSVLVTLFSTGCPSTESERDDSEVILINQSGPVGTLAIPENGKVTAPEGKQVTMTKDHVETGFEAGATYKNVYLTVTDDIPLPYTNTANADGTWAMNYRTALLVDDDGVSSGKSVKDAVISGEYDNNSATGVNIISNGENFNGIIVTGNKEYTIKDAVIRMTGNGGNDFKGFGAAILAVGKSKVVVDNADIETRGVVRTALVAGQGAKVLVKNSVFVTRDGVQDPGYVGTVDTAGMKSVPWMLGLDGNCRATNLLNDAVITYYNSDISAEKWGVLSTDENDGLTLTAVNSTVKITGNSGYGTYSIGDTQVTFAGVELTVPDYAAICANGGSSVTFTSSDAANIAGIYGLDGETVTSKKTVINTQRFGVMYHSSSGTGVTKINSGTELHTGLTTFLVKGCPANIEADGAVITSGSKVILQLMDNDDAGIDVANNMSTTVNYVEPDFTQVLVAGRDLTSAIKGTDVTAIFKDMTLEGDIYNSSGYAEMSAPPPPAAWINSAADVGGGLSTALNRGGVF
ncbi:MAG: hypothetical protein LBT16_11950, partial [Treponema sp.]|nr:hypothetical protein [Treponema sp.]